MASGVNVKMGVSGLSQFKNNMNQAKQATKTLDAQLALTEKQFKQTGDAESYMTEKSELLKAKLEQQKQVVSNAEKALEQMREKGVDTSSKAYQDLYRQMINAKGAMIDTQNELEGVATAGADAAAGVDGMNEQLQSIGKNVSYESINNALSKITGGMEAAMKKAIELGKAITKEVLGAGSWADDLNTRATYFQMTPEELQRMEKTATLIDTSVDTIINSRNKLKKGLGNDTKNVGAALNALLGEGAEGKNWEDIFWDAGEALMKLGDAEEQEAYAQALFGKSWHELIPLFEAGREEYEKLNESWSVVPQEQIDALQEMDDQYQKLSVEMETLKMTFMGELAPAVKSVMEVLTGLMQEFNTYLSTDEGKEFMDSLGKAVESLFTDLSKIDPEKTLQDVTGIINGIKDGLQWIAEHGEAVKIAVEGFIGAWMLAKTAEGITTVMQLVNGIRGLTAGTAAVAGATAGASWAGAFASAAMKAAPFLAFLYTMLNPSSTSDATGNNTLIDEEGKPTTEAEAYGIKVDEKGDVVLGEVPEEYTKESNAKTFHLPNLEGLLGLIAGGKEDLLQNGWDIQETEDWDGASSYDVMAAIARMNEETENNRESTKKSTEDMTDAAGDMSKAAKNLPQNVRDALMGLKIVLDEQTVGQIIDSYLASKMD